MEMLAQMNWSQWLLSVVLIGICLLLILVVLVQRGRGSGLTGAFGGAGGGGGAFGAKTGDVFTWITVVIAIVFLFLAVVGNFVLDQTPESLAVTTSTAVPAETDDAAPGGAGVAAPSNTPADQPDGDADAETKKPAANDDADKPTP